jgi:hypothetical protein
MHGVLHGPGVPRLGTRSQCKSAAGARCGAGHQFMQEGGFRMGNGRHRSGLRLAAWRSKERRLSARLQRAAARRDRADAASAQSDRRCRTSLVAVCGAEFGKSDAQRRACGGDRLLHAAMNCTTAGIGLAFIA